MGTYLLISVIGGVLFGVMDGLLNANRMAAKLFAVFKPIARPSINFILGILIDLAYGFVLAGLYLLLQPALPGGTGLLNGLSFALIVWFLRVVMSAASGWLMYRVEAKTVAYSLLAGLGEMLALGVLYGLTLQPAG